uniref:Uncharacterized protein n=1 Tax=Drosophila melanogaster TaxID=7227 RepID=A0A0B4K836_DROME|nr:uncharacterized protein Dmel_CG43296 [Drosophila melanogaster]AFH07957.1 uncharacterized protein Dmel_CG43296 [Drosophila melanogaster]|eukprot:NP_001246202.1 uncharacterized protein Dmel_CG43296 [Drosophila melanogaster]
MSHQISSQPPLSATYPAKREQDVDMENCDGENRGKTTCCAGDENTDTNRCRLVPGTRITHGWWVCARIDEQPGPGPTCCQYNQFSMSHIIRAVSRTEGSKPNLQPQAGIFRLGVI